MKALLWKDYRINRLILFLGAAFIVGPYAVVLLTLWLDPQRASSAMAWADLLIGACQVSLALSLVTAATLGGNAFAGERADRSAEFLAYLPPSRLKILLSKAALSLSAMAGIWVLHLIVMLVLVPSFLGDRSLRWDPTSATETLAALSAVLFGIGWGASSFLESTSNAASIAFGAPVAVGAVFMGSSNWFDWPANEDFGHYFTIACFTMGIIGFVLGTLHYLRRVEP